MLASTTSTQPQLHHHQQQQQQQQPVRGTRSTRDARVRPTNSFGSIFVSAERQTVSRQA